MCCGAYMRRHCTQGRGGTSRAPSTVLASFIAFPYFDTEATVAAIQALDSLANASAGQSRVSLATSLSAAPGISDTGAAGTCSIGISQTGCHLRHACLGWTA